MLSTLNQETRQSGSQTELHGPCSNLYYRRQIAFYSPRPGPKWYSFHRWMPAFYCLVTKKENNQSLFSDGLIVVVPNDHRSLADRSHTLRSGHSSRLCAYHPVTRRDCGQMRHCSLSDWWQILRDAVHWRAHLVLQTRFAFLREQPPYCGYSCWHPWISAFPRIDHWRYLLLTAWIGDHSGPSSTKNHLFQRQCLASRQTCKKYQNHENA